MSWLFGKSSSSSQQETSSQYNEENVASHITPESVSSFISQPVDISQLHPLAGLNQGLEYLNIEDEGVTSMPGGTGILPIKDWTDDLCYGTGAVYLTGLGIGGTYGFAEGLRKTAGSTSARLRINGVLNAMTRRGPFLGNTAGVLAMTYNLINSSIGYFRGEHDILNSLAAGAVSGALFRVTRGVRQMAIASGFMTVAAGSWSLLKQAIF